jgi:hypothetical protein
MLRAAIVRSRLTKQASVIRRAVRASRQPGMAQACASAASHRIETRDFSLYPFPKSEKNG